MRYYLIFVVAMILLSCNEQPIAIPNAVIPAEGRVILIEDLTGVKCPPCHGASLFLDAQIEAADGAIVVYGIHGDLQSDPHSDSKYDFRYEDAATLEGTFNFFGKPAAAFNRIEFENGLTAQGRWDTWQPFIDAELVKPQVAEIFITPTYDPETRQVEIALGVISLEDILGDVQVHVVITESHLIDPQDSQTSEGKIVDFEHMHVMKESLTSIPGGDFLVTDLIKNETETTTYSYTIPEENNGEWIPENMEIVAYITAVDRENEVQQAAQAHVIE